MVYITSYYSKSFIPATGISGIQVHIWNTASGTLVESGIMSEVGGGFYRYNFTSYNPQVAYNIRSYASGSSFADFERYKVSSTEAGQVGFIYEDTNEMQGKLPINKISDQSLVDASLSTIESKIDIVQADLDNPSQYMADTSQLATEVNASSNRDLVISEINANESKIDYVTGIVSSTWNIVQNLPSDTQSTFSGMISTLNRIAGLVHENIYTQNVWQGNNLVSSTLECYDSAQSAQAHDGASGMVAKYSLSATYDINKPITYLMRRDYP